VEISCGWISTATLSKLIFYKDAEDLSTHAMLQMVDDSIVPPPMIASASAIAEMPRVANARSTRR
jgi:hypothetical protein